SAVKVRSDKPGPAEHKLRQQTEPRAIQTWGDAESVDPVTGLRTVTSTCCPLHEGEMVSSRDKFSVIDAGARPVAGGTDAHHRFEYIGAADDLGPVCQCSCCSFVQ